MPTYACLDDLGKVLEDLLWLLHFEGERCDYKQILSQWLTDTSANNRSLGVTCVQALCGAPHRALSARWRMRCLCAKPARLCVMTILFPICVIVVSVIVYESLQPQLSELSRTPSQPEIQHTGACGTYVPRWLEVRRSKSLSMWPESSQLGVNPWKLIQTQLPGLGAHVRQPWWYVFCVIITNNFCSNLIMYQPIIDHWSFAVFFVIADTSII